MSEFDLENVWVKIYLKYQVNKYGEVSVQVSALEPKWAHKWAYKWAHWIKSERTSERTGPQSERIKS